LVVKEVNILLRGIADLVLLCLVRRDARVSDEVLAKFLHGLLHYDHGLTAGASRLLVAARHLCLLGWRMVHLASTSLLLMLSLHSSVVKSIDSRVGSCGNTSSICSDTLALVNSFAA